MPEIKCRRLEGKVAIITAATKGIGYAIAERLGLEGASVIIGSRGEENVKQAIASLQAAGVKNVEGIAGNIGKPEDQQKLVDLAISKFGRIDILVNNHGISPSFGHILEVTDTLWDKLFQINVKAGWQMVKLVHPHMVKVGGGNIVFNASYTAYKTIPGIATYAVTKTTLLGLTKALANGLAKDNIRVNGIAPGIIKTKMSQVLWDGNGQEGQDTLADTEQIALGRLGVPEDCAGTVAFLVSDDAAYITGETICVTGGIQSRL